ncbi:MAG: Hsp20/alpha crystallin family protein [Deltaproteobacteria bacterium]|nr:Hsp20/alpha crystallin family protein [Deltaproteobacteria bacterium]
MNIKKLAPWNWFKKEQEEEGKSLPVVHKHTETGYPHPLMQIHQEIDRLFDDMFRSFAWPIPGFWKEPGSMARTEWLKPTLDIAATDGEYTISVELPGVDEKEVQLELVDDTLTIKGEKKHEKEEKKKDFYRMERSYGAFRRVLSLPEDADRDNIKATYKNGVMTISVPRTTSEQKQGRCIEINKP